MEISPGKASSDKMVGCRDSHGIIRERSQNWQVPDPMPLASLMPLHPPHKTRKRRMKSQEENGLCARKKKTSLEDLSIIIYYFFAAFQAFIERKLHAGSRAVQFCFD